MGTTMNISELQKVSYLQVGGLQGRAVPLFPCYHEDGSFELWIANADVLIRMESSKIVEGKFFAKSRRANSDLYLAFFDFMCKRAYWNEIVPFIEGIYDDLQNIGACLAKLDLFFYEWKRTNFDARRFVTTELEYLFSVCRSLYDLLQESISKMWAKFEFHNSTLGKKNLPKSFRGMILENDLLLSKDQIVAKYAIPEPMADYYLRQAHFFTWLRDFRDYISHSGKSIDFAFATEKGFAVSIDTKPFSSMDFWTDSNTQPYRLGSVKSLTAYLVSSTFRAVEEFAQLISRIIVFPDDIAPGYNVYICGPNTANLKNLDSYITEKPWYE